ncbi:hypothetical protein ASE48_10170 [Mycobacterium sp. Root265]|uniref:hypothetical protein n=1 Tax=Mycobacterium sp. Root265 TaxID=1736504 RepID=UPI00070DE5CE|nr:hypothetical protein [Mycobacterium sp. Root265]KRD07793.1 hypothetical protein ASE48_10170 [Mycobacterium sp. Root265]
MTAAVDRDYAARWEVDGARGHADTMCCLIDSATEHLDGAQRTCAEAILDRARLVLADLDRLAEVLR